MEEIVIREAVIHDMPGICHIHRNDDDPWSRPAECAAWVTKRKARGFYIQVALINDMVVGHGEWVVSDEASGKHYYLGLLQIDDDFQKRGIGRQMLADGARVAKTQGIKKIVTIPEIETGSHLFYAKCGFETGRNIMGVTLPVRDHGYSQKYTAYDGAPYKVVAKEAFVFGAFQASARHMWEVYNQKPVADDRNVATLLSDSGECIQLGWYAKNHTAHVLFWSNRPTHEKVLDILTFANGLSFRYVNFMFFEEYAKLLRAFDGDVNVRDREIYLMV